MFRKPNPSTSGLVDKKKILETVCEASVELEQLDDEDRRTAKHLIAVIIDHVLFGCSPHGLIPLSDFLYLYGDLFTRDSFATGYAERAICDFILSPSSDMHEYVDYKVYAGSAIHLTWKGMHHLMSVDHPDLNTSVVFWKRMTRLYKTATFVVMEAHRNLAGLHDLEDDYEDADRAEALKARILAVTKAGLAADLVRVIKKLDEDIVRAMGAGGFKRGNGGWAATKGDIRCYDLRKQLTIDQAKFIDCNAFALKKAMQEKWRDEREDFLREFFTKLYNRTRRFAEDEGECARADDAEHADGDAEHAEDDPGHAEDDAGHAGDDAGYAEDDAGHAEGDAGHAEDDERTKDAGHQGTVDRGKGRAAKRAKRG